MVNKRKKKRVAVFDIDGTIFRSSLLIEFNKGLMKSGVIPESVIADIREEYFAWVERRGSYDAYVSKVVEMHGKAIRGKEKKYVDAAADIVFLNHRDRVYRYTRDLVRRLKHDHLLLAISGSPVEMVEPFGKYFGFDNVWGSIYGVDRQGRYTGEVLDLRSVNEKDVILKSYVAEHNLTLRGSWGVGDTESDVGILKLVDHPIAFNPTSRLVAIAKRKHWPIVVERKDVIYEIPGSVRLSKKVLPKV